VIGFEKRADVVAEIYRLLIVVNGAAHRFMEQNQKTMRITQINSTPLTMP